MFFHALFSARQRSLGPHASTDVRRVRVSAPARGAITGERSQVEKGYDKPKQKQSCPLNRTGAGSPQPSLSPPPSPVLLPQDLQVTVSV